MSVNHRTLRAGLLSALLLLPLAVSAQSLIKGNGVGGMHYKWTDKTGLVHFSDSLEPSAIENGYVVINDRGVVVNHVDRALTPEEKDAASKAAVAAADAKKEADAQAKADAQMLAAYPTEAVYKDLLDQSVKALNQSIATTELNLKSQREALAQGLQQAAAIQRDKKSVPKNVSDPIDKEQAAVLEQQKTLDRQTAKRDELIKAQPALLDHYRKAQAAANAPAAGATTSSASAPAQ